MNLDTVYRAMAPEQKMILASALGSQALRNFLLLAMVAIEKELAGLAQLDDEKLIRKYRFLRVELDTINSIFTLSEAVDASRRSDN